MTHRRFYRLEQLAVAVVIAAAGLLFGLRLLYRAVDDMTTFPAGAR